MVQNRHNARPWPWPLCRSSHAPPVRIGLSHSPILSNPNNAKPRLRRLAAHLARHPWGLCSALHRWPYAETGTDAAIKGERGTAQAAVARHPGRRLVPLGNVRIRPSAHRAFRAVLRKVLRLPLCDHSQVPTRPLGIPTRLRGEAPGFHAPSPSRTIGFFRRGAHAVATTGPADKRARYRAGPARCGSARTRISRVNSLSAMICRPSASKLPGSSQAR